MSQFKHLFSPLVLRGREIRNRILSTGHQTYLSSGGVHEARAKGGAGLIIVEAARFHHSALSDSLELIVDSDKCIPGYARIAEAVHHHGAKIFAQLSHPGRLTRRMRAGLRGVAVAPSAVMDNRFHTIPRAMPIDLIEELIKTCGTAASRFAMAGLDGVELVASHGLLFAQFLNPKCNFREDKYGGDRENRMRFLAECLASVRRGVGEDVIVGMRISAEEIEDDGLDAAEVIAVCTALAKKGALDYVNVTTGSMAGLGGSIHVVPPMQVKAAYVAPQAGTLRAAIGVPVFVAGRINQPQIAEQVLASGLADMCGMTLYCMQSGLHRTLPPGVPAILHSESRDGPRSKNRRFKYGDARKARSCCRWWTCGYEGGRHGSSARTHRDAGRGWFTAGRPGAPRTIAS